MGCVFIDVERFKILICLPSQLLHEIRMRSKIQAQNNINADSGEKNSAVDNGFQVEENA